MAAVADVKLVAVVYGRTAIIIAYGKVCKPGQDIYLRNDAGIGLDGLHIRLNFSYKLCVKPCLKGVYLFFGTKNGVFVFLRLRGNVALCCYKSLLAYPLRGNLILISIPYLEVITEYVVEADL